jgi:hypothetical protein
MKSCQTCDGSGYLTLFSSRERCRECELADKFNADYEEFSRLLRASHLARCAAPIDHVVLWSNGMVMVTDHDAHQLPDYQGPANVCVPKILRDAPESAKFYRGNWGRSTEMELEQISRVAFIAAAAAFFNGVRTGEPIPR